MDRQLAPDRAGSKAHGAHAEAETQGGWVCEPMPVIGNGQFDAAIVREQLDLYRFRARVLERVLDRFLSYSV